MILFVVTSTFPVRSKSYRMLSLESVKHQGISLQNNSNHVVLHWHVREHGRHCVDLHMFVTVSSPTLRHPMLTMSCVTFLGLNPRVVLIFRCSGVSLPAHDVVNICCATKVPIGYALEVAQRKMKTATTTATATLTNSLILLKD